MKYVSFLKSYLSFSYLLGYVFHSAAYRLGYYPGAKPLVWLLVAFNLLAGAYLYFGPPKAIKGWSMAGVVVFNAILAWLVSVS